MTQGTIIKQEGKKRISTVYIVLTALFTALCYTATMLFNIPAAFILGAGGNINLGDSIIFLAAVVLGPVGGAITGAFGASLADITSAYFIYAPFTFAIKGAAGFIVGFLFKYALKDFGKALRRILPMAAGALLIISGYFFAEIIITAVSGAAEEALLIIGLRTIIPNLIQVTVSGIIAVIVLPRIPHISAFSEFSYTE